MVVLPPEDGMSEGGQRRESNWPRDEFGQCEAHSWINLLWITLFAAILLSFSWLGAERRGSNSVIAYCAQDQTYAEEIFRDFQKQSGIKVRAVYDSEAVKTVGLANRLLAERSHPQCDLFWGNEEMRARQLAAQDAFRESNGLAFFGYRTRCLVYNTNRLAPGAVPHSVLELTNDTWRGKVALAYPQFGTTAAHFHALRQHWGEAAWETWCRALVANKPLLVDGNSVVVKMVGSGEGWIGLTDSDDIAAGQADGSPVAAAPSFEESVLIPNSVAIVRGAPHPGPAQKLFDYLQQPATVQKLIAAHALEGASMAGLTEPALKVDWNPLLRDLNVTTEKLNRIFLR